MNEADIQSMVLNIDIAALFVAILSGANHSKVKLCGRMMRMTGCGGKLEMVTVETAVRGL